MSREARSCESLLLFVVGSAVLTTSDDGIGFRLTLADGPSLSRILAEEVLGEFILWSGKFEIDSVVGVDGLGKFDV